jgi:hypothetical protein
MSTGKQPATSDLRLLDETERERLRAEGWHFSSDKRKAVATTDEDVDPLHLVCRSGALASPTVLGVLRSLTRPVELKARALLAVATLAEKDHGRGIVLSQGGADAVVHAMREGANHSTLAANGCAALANLALGEGASKVLGAQGVEATLEAMAAHAGHAAVQAKGALALANVSFVDEGEARVLEAGGVRAVAGALALAPLDVAVAEEVCDCLVNLASSASGRGALDAFAMWGGDGGGGGGGGGPATVSAGLPALLASVRALCRAHPECSNVRECLACIERAVSVGCPSRRFVLVRFTPAPPRLVSPDTEPAGALSWARAEPVLLGSYHANSSAHRPHVEARLLHDGRCLFVRFDVHEDRHVRAQYGACNDPVYRDSCVEIFLQVTRSPSDCERSTSDCATQIVRHRLCKIALRLCEIGLGLCEIGLRWPVIEDGSAVNASSTPPLSLPSDGNSLSGSASPAARTPTSR